MRKALVILIVLFGVFLAIGCAGNKGGTPKATVTPVQAITPVKEVTPVKQVTKTTIAGNNTTVNKTTIIGNNTTATKTTVTSNKGY